MYLRRWLLFLLASGLYLSLNAQSGTGDPSLNLSTEQTVETLRLAYYELGRGVRTAIQTQIGDRQRLEHQHQVVNRFLGTVAEV